MRVAFDPPVEGKGGCRGEHGLDVGDMVDVTLLHTTIRIAVCVYRFWAGIGFC